MLIGTICGAIAMSVFCVVGLIILDEGRNNFGYVLLGPAMWVLLIMMFIHEDIYKRLFKGITLTKYTFEHLKRNNTYYKHLVGNYHLLRYYGNKDKHPILYHLILIEKVKVK